MRLKEEWIDPYALRIVQSLRKRGHQAYLVGGCVRDLLAGEHPKDFDIATDALPDAARKCIPNSYVIGKRFKLVLVKRGPHQFEVATFRRQARPEELEDENKVVSGDNYFGTVEQDAVRRDFTINALFYDPLDHQMVDYVQGLQDIENRLIRMIGEPITRLEEDSIRILRAVRLAHKLQFRIEENLRAGIEKTHSFLEKSALPRRREEYIKILRLKEPHRAWLELKDLGVLKTILPFFDEFLDSPERRDQFIQYSIQMPTMVGAEKSPAELFGAFLFSILRSQFPDSPLNVESLESNPNWENFVKNQLGVFKQEISDFYRILLMMNQLEKIDTFKRKGGRRQRAITQSLYFPVALRWAYAERRLPFADLLFWLNQLPDPSSSNVAESRAEDPKV